jgi:hypothetical protein
MKKSLIKSYYCLQVIHDGSSLFLWAHPWKSRGTIFVKDLTQHPLWNPIKKTIEFNDDPEIKNYTKTFEIK